MKYFYYIIENNCGVIVDKYQDENEFKECMLHVNRDRSSGYRSIFNQDVGEVLNNLAGTALEGVDCWRGDRWL